MWLSVRHNKIRAYRIRFDGSLIKPRPEPKKHRSLGDEHPCIGTVPMPGYPNTVGQEERVGEISSRPVSRTFEDGQFRAVTILFIPLDVVESPCSE